jgi:hypothetical protein
MTVQRGIAPRWLFPGAAALVHTSEPAFALDKPGSARGGDASIAWEFDVGQKAE